MTLKMGISNLELRIYLLANLKGDIMTPEQKNALRTVVNTLNTVETKGRENMNHLLGAIVLLEQMISAEEAPDIKIKEAPDISLRKDDN